MKRLRRSVESLVKNLDMLNRKTEMIVSQLDRLEGSTKEAVTPKPVSASGRKPVKRAAAKKTPAVKAAARKKDPVRAAAAGKSGASATQVVLAIINRSKKGLDTAALQQKTGYGTRKIWDIVHRAYKQGKIRKSGRGAYSRA